MVTPIFKLIANGEDVTKILNENSVSITLSDNDGEFSDELSISVVGDFERPEAGDVLDFYIGNKEEVLGLRHAGRYFVQSTEIENLHTLIISATSVDWNEELKEQRDHKYAKTNIKKICEEIAKRHSLKVRTDCSDIPIGYIAQQDENDLEFLSKLADRYDLIFNIKHETIIMLHRYVNDDRSELLPFFDISALECESIRIKHSNRTHYNSAKAVWRETKTNLVKVVKVLKPRKAKKVTSKKRRRKKKPMPKKIVPKSKTIIRKKKVKVVHTKSTGYEKPVLLVKDDFHDEVEAKLVAKASMMRENRSIINGSITHYGLWVVAGGTLELEDAGGDSDQYTIKSVQHTLNGSGWMTDMEIEG